MLPHAANDCFETTVSKSSLADWGLPTRLSSPSPPALKTSAFFEKCHPRYSMSAVGKY